MLPGKTYTPESALLVFKRRFWLLLVPFATLSAVTAVVAHNLPDVYESSAVLMVMPQQVSESVVRSAVATAMSDRLPTIQYKVLSRGKLESIITEYNLYAEERKTELMEDVVDQMKKDITVQPLRADAFVVKYRNPDVEKAYKVTERLANYFRDENTIDRDSIVEKTGQFLEAQLLEAKGQLQDQEKKLQNYREKNSGQMPTQAERNMLALQNTWQNIQATVESINHDKERRLLLERQLADLTAETPTDTQPPQTLTEPDLNGGVAVQGGTAQQLAYYKSLLVAFEQRGLTPDHPDVARTKRLIAGLQKTADAEALQLPVSATDNGPRVSPAEQARRAKVADIQANIAQIDEQIAAKQAEEAKLRPGATMLQQRIDGVPARESEMVEMMRDYATYQGVYQNLLAKKLDSKISESLERAEGGQQFRVIDQARRAQKPISPDRRRINMTGMMVGLGFDLALIVLLEYRDSSFTSDDEVTRLLTLPVLAVVPIMESKQARQRGARRRMFVNIALGSTVAGCFAVVVLYMFVFVH